jgi:hypothetical protein
MLNIFEKTTPTCFIDDDLKKNQHKLADKKVASHPKNSFNFWFMRNNGGKKRSQANKEPCTKPQVTNVRFAPCHNPDKPNVAIILATCRPEEQRLPPSGM